MTQPAIPSGPDALTAAWVEEILVASEACAPGALREIHVEPFAEGRGLLGKLVRVHLTHDESDPAPPETLVIKFPSDSADNVALCEAISLYAREHAFYTRSARECPLRVPRMYHANMANPREFVLVMEDVTWGIPGNQIEGATEAQVRAAGPAVAAHHAAFFGRARAGSRDWLPRLDEPGIVGVVQALTRAGAEALTRHLSDSFTPETRRVTLALADHMPALCASICSGATTFVHGDYRVDNLFFGNTKDEPTLTVVDWQICYEACPPYDVAYLMSQSVEPELRRRVEAEVLDAYYRELLECGVTGYDVSTCREDYRKAVTYCLCYPLIAAGTLDLSNDRGRALGARMLARSLTAIEDVDAGALLASLPA